MKPPPLPSARALPADPYAAWHHSGTPGGIAHTDARTHALILEILSGTRFRTIPYVFSLAVVSIKREQAGIEKVTPDQWPIGNLLRAAAITSIFGWPGLPTGPIYSLLASYYLWNGGQDRTRQVLTEWVGPEEASKILLQAKRPVPPKKIWLVRIVLCIPLLVVLALYVGFLVSDA